MTDSNTVGRPTEPNDGAISRRRAALGGAAIAAGAMAAPSISSLGITPAFAQDISAGAVDFRSNCDITNTACFFIPATFMSGGTNGSALDLADVDGGSVVPPIQVATFCGEVLETGDDLTAFTATVGPRPGLPPGSVATLANGNASVCVESNVLGFGDAINCSLEELVLDDDSVAFGSQTLTVGSGVAISATTTCFDVTVTGPGQVVLCVRVQCDTP